MPKFNIEIEGIKGEAVERFAALADRSPEEQILDWIKEKVNHATVVAMRASGKPWEAVAEAIGHSTTEARRIYARSQDLPIATKEQVRILERYVDLIERVEEIHLTIPSPEDIDMVVRLTEALEEAKDAGEGVWVPKEDDIEATERLAKAQKRAED
jgi:predicted ATPase